MSHEVAHLREVHRVFSTAKGRVHALDGVDLSIGAGEWVGLVGESGSGKTTLARILMGLDRPTSGTVTLWDVDIGELGRRARGRLRRRFGVVFQDPYSSLNPRLSLERIIAEPLEIHHWGTRQERSQRILELLDAVGLQPRWRERRVSELSGGQRQRVAIARAIALGPDLLILDEPVSGLDVSVQAQVLNLLADLRERMRFSALFISHDLAVVRHVADRVVVMYLGRIVEEASTSALFAEPHHPYAIALLSSLADVDDADAAGRIILVGDPPSPMALPSGCRFRSRCFRAHTDCAHTDPRLEPVAESHWAACLFPGPVEPRPANPSGRDTSPAPSLGGGVS